MATQGDKNCLNLFLWPPQKHNFGEGPLAIGLFYGFKKENFHKIAPNHTEP